MDDDGCVFPGMAIAYKLQGTDNSAEDMEHNIKFTLFEERGDGGIFFGLGSEIISGLFQILTLELNGIPEACFRRPGKNPYSGL